MVISPSHHSSTKHHQQVERGDEDNMMNNNLVSAQLQIRKNADEQTEFLKDLGEWNKEMTALDRGAHKTKAISEEQKCKGANPSSIKRAVAKAPSPVIYRSNHKFAGNELTTMNSSETERLRGNTLYSNGRYEEAIQAYTKALQLNPHSATAYSNRAMAYIKVKEWQSAESDATAAINLDPFHIKSYQRRSMARSSQGKLRASLHDLYRARMILSGIKETNEEMHRIHSDIDKIESLLLQAIKKAPKKLIPIISTENKINT